MKKKRYLSGTFSRTVPGLGTGKTIVRYEMGSVWPPATRSDYRRAEYAAVKYPD